MEIIIGIVFLVLGLYMMTKKFLAGLTFIIIAIIVGKRGLDKKTRNDNTKKLGQKTYAKIIEFQRTGNFVLDKEEYKINTATYIPLQDKYAFIEEVIGYNVSKYSKTKYLEVLYYNNDINIIKNVEENEIPGDILRKLNVPNIENEYKEYVEEKRKIRIENEEKTEKGVNSIASKLEKAQKTYKFIYICIFDILAMIVSSFIPHLINRITRFGEYGILSLVYIGVLIINIASVYSLRKGEKALPVVAFFITFVFFILQAIE